MAGHSQFKNIMYRKGAQDAKRAKLFSKLAREISAAVKVGGEDPGSNPRLRAAILAARGANMTKDAIERAVNKGSGADMENWEEIQYEGFGPGGVSIIVEALSDNRNRTASEIRSKFSKNGGNLGESGSVAYQFDRLGYIVYPAAVANADAMFEAALEAGASDVESGDDVHEIYCDMTELAAVRDVLEEKLGDAKEARLTWRPNLTVDVDAEAASGLFKLLDMLEDDDDVQRVYANFSVDESVLDSLNA